MVGREEEMKQLETNLEEIVKEKGGALFISGEAGIGKTRLLQELRSVAEAKGFLFLCGNGLYESLTPYMPIYEALKSGGLEHLFTEEVPRVEAIYLVTRTGLLIKDVIRKETELSSDIFASMLTTVGDFVKESMTKFLGKEKEGSLNTLGYEDYRILIESGKSINLVAVMTGRENEFLIDDMKEIRQKVENNFGTILQEWDGDEEGVSGIEKIILPLIESGKYDGVYYGEKDPKVKRNLLFQSVSLGLSRLSEMRPIVLCIEDLQWVDPSTMALMHHVAMINRNKRLLVLGTYRPEDVSSDHALVETKQMMDRIDLFKEVNLRRLPREVISDFLGILGKIEFDEEFVSRIYSETEGNPLFIIQLMKYLVEDKIIECRDGIWRLIKSLDDVAIPSKIYNVILRRLNRVKKEERKLLDFACVNGEIFTSAILAAALSARKSDVLERLRDLERTHRLINSRNGSFKFDHAKIKEVLYNEIPNELRKEYHETIANAIEGLNRDNLESVVEDLAYHYYRSRNGAKALNYLYESAKKAKNEYSNKEAIRFYNEALEFEDDRTKRVEILEMLGDICDLVGDYDKSLRFYKEAIDLAEETGRKVGINAKVGGILWKKGEYDESIRTCKGVLDKIDSKDLQVRSLALSHIGIVHYQRFDNERALEYFNKSLKLREKIKDRKSIAASLNNIANIYASRGEFDKALEHYKRAKKDREDLNDQYGLSATLQNIGILYGEMEEYDKSKRYLKEGLQTRRKIGDLRGIAESLSNIADILVETNEYDEALEYYQKSIEIVEHIGQKLMMAYNYRPMAELYFRMGDMQKTQELCTRALKLAEDIGNEQIVANAYRNLGMMHREQARWNESIEDFEKSINFLREKDAPRSLGLTYHEFGLMWIKKGDVKRAKYNLEKALKFFTDTQWKKKITEVMRVLKTL